MSKELYLYERIEFDGGLDLSGEPLRIYRSRLMTMFFQRIANAAIAYGNISINHVEADDSGVTVKATIFASAPLTPDEGEHRVIESRRESAQT